MALSINYYQLKKRLIFVFAILVFTGAYIIVNRSVNSLQTTMKPSLLHSETDNIELNRIISFSKNYTIINAIVELNTGYENLVENNKLHAGFSSTLLEGIRSQASDRNESETNKYPFVHTLYKYHPFFTAYSKSLNAIDLYLFEPQNGVLLYSSNLNDHLLEKYESPEITRFIGEIKSHCFQQDAFQLQLENSPEALIGTPVIYNKQLVGILIVKIKQEQVL